MTYGSRTACGAGVLVLVAALVRAGAPAAPSSFRFAILGDRTGEAVAGVWEQVWREVAGEKPAFAIETGDMIEGRREDAAAGEWREVESVLKPFSALRLYAVPGNHDIWSDASEALYERHTGRPPHYSFDCGEAHFTVLDNSRSDELPAAELSFLESDLKAHAAQPLKLVFMHRPYWLLDVAARNPNFALHKIARKYGVRYVIAGHLHQLLHLELDGVTYVSMLSSGGHLRASGEYKDGWFFGHALVEVNGAKADFKIEELRQPHGLGRVTGLADWGLLGLATGRKAP